MKYNLNFRVQDLNKYFMPLQYGCLFDNNIRVELENLICSKLP